MSNNNTTQDNFNFKDLFGDKPLIGKDGKKVDCSELGKSDVIGLYFSAHWCPPCRGFTPVLVDTYNKAKKAGASVEIVFISSDSNQKQFDKYFSDMPWLALDYEDREKKKELSEKFGVQGIPNFLLLNGKNGEILTKDGRSLVTELKEKFAKEAVQIPARKKKAEAMLSDLSLLQTKDDDETKVDGVSKCDYIFVAFGNPENRGWQQYVKPKLVDAIETLKKGENKDKFEVFYISTDANEDCSKDTKQPWRTLPNRHNLELWSTIADASAPGFTIIDVKKKAIVEENAVRFLYNTGASGYPWTTEAKEAMEAKERARVTELKKQLKDFKIFDDCKTSFVGQGGKSKSFDEIKKADVLGFYFSAHWCGPCRRFTPQLAKTYNECKNAGKSFEVVFFSSDRDQSSFDDYFKDMPWTALSFDKRELKETMSEIFEVNGIPSLILLNNDGSEITKSGRNAVSLGSEYFPWGEEEIKKGEAAALVKAEEERKKALAKEKEMCKKQKDNDLIVLRRHRGAPGQSTIDPSTQEINFTSFDTFRGDVKATKGKFFYEIVCVDVANGIAQVGWCDESFEETSEYSGEGVGDDEHSWGFDGNRVCKWFDGNERWGKGWKNGDILGCAIDLDAKTVSFGLNGDWNSPMGTAFKDIKFDGSVAPAITAQGQTLRVNFGSPDGQKNTFKYGPPDDSFKALHGAKI